MGGASRETRAAKGSSSTGLDEEDMERLIAKVCNNLLTKFDNKLDSRFQRLESKLTQACESMDNLTAGIENNAAKLMDLEERLDSYDQERKKNCIRICGLPENSHDDLMVSVVNFISNNLKIVCSKRDIDYCFRVGVASKEVLKPRVVVVRFIHNWMKNEVFGAKKVLKNSPFAVFEDLTAKRFELLLEAKKRYGTNKAWSSRGNIFYWDHINNKKALMTNKS